ncbi:hypothetical protein DesLBE_1549 [Desulfitobacterium sp. LBE]|nr:hypothetical protein DesLBE_1549 [Desulfitobacterium sp. LBE]
MRYGTIKILKTNIACKKISEVNNPTGITEIYGLLTWVSNPQGIKGNFYTSRIGKETDWQRLAKMLSLIIGLSSFLIAEKGEFYMHKLLY